MKYEVPKVWTWKKGEGKFSHINRPESGALSNEELPRGKHALQLYSLATPNGVKVNILLEELLEKGVREAEYDAYPIKILEGKQFSSGFVEINPNSKIPALVDYSEKDPIAVFESGSILLYLAEKFNSFLPENLSEKTQTLNWLFWQMGSAPYLGGGFGHFYAYAPEKYEYPLNRFTLETKRQLDVLDKQLNDKTYICGEAYTIADMAIWPWYGALVRGDLYDAAEFLETHSYKNLVRWAHQISERPSVKKARVITKTWGESDEQVPERHSSDDFAKIKLK